MSDHNGHGINLYGVLVILMGNIQTGGRGGGRGGGGLSIRIHRYEVILHSRYRHYVISRTIIILFCFPVLFVLKSTNIYTTM